MGFLKVRQARLHRLPPHLPHQGKSGPVGGVGRLGLAMARGVDIDVEQDHGPAPRELP
jgi:hypothetical protein